MNSPQNEAIDTHSQAMSSKWGNMHDCAVSTNAKTIKEIFCLMVKSILYTHYSYSNASTPAKAYTLPFIQDKVINTPQNAAIDTYSQALSSYCPPK